MKDLKNQNLLHIFTRCFNICCLNFIVVCSTTPYILAFFKDFKKKSSTFIIVSNSNWSPSFILSFILWIFLFLNFFLYSDPIFDWHRYAGSCRYPHACFCVWICIGRRRRGATLCDTVRAALRPFWITPYHPRRLHAYVRTWCLVIPDSATPYHIFLPSESPSRRQTPACLHAQVLSINQNFSTLLSERTMTCFWLLALNKNRGGKKARVSPMIIKALIKKKEVHMIINYSHSQYY